MAEEMKQEEWMGGAGPAATAAAVAGKVGGAAVADGGAGAGEGIGDGPLPDSGLEFWSRQSDLWSGVFTEQQTGLLQMVRAQEAELRQGKRRISSLEQELSALNDKRAEIVAKAQPAEAVAAAALGLGNNHKYHGGEGVHHSLSEAEANDWRQRLEQMQADYEQRLSVVQERESAVATAELRVESAARELGSERDRLTAGAVALSAEADSLR